ncbi:MAG: hypothetical protein OXG85_16640 [Chloroflexi bacterium]|nr:hypothetical protein [Chloroflexota bacterium]
MIPQKSSADESRRGAPSYFSYAVFACSLIAGIALGLAFTRAYGPLQRGNAEPWQLRADERHHFAIAIALEHAHHGDMARSLHKLIALRPAQHPLDALADAACVLGSSGYLRSDSGISALRSAVALYTAGGRAGCAEQLLPLSAIESAPDPIDDQASAADFARPLPTKPPLSEGQAQATIRRLVPRPVALRSFEARAARSTCDASNPALIEAHVVDYLGRGIPGQRIRVRWGDQADIFVSGLKLDRGDSYADFQMEEGIEYAIDMPGAADPLGASLSAGACYSGNRRLLKSWRVTFVET